MSNVYVQPVDGGLPTALTHFASEEVFYFDWGPDQRSVVCALVKEARRVVLLR